MIRFSIIVPIYNREKTLCRCVESLMNQTYKEIEIILIDDGSEDKSFDICKRFALKDKRVIPVHIEKCGVSSARNIGVSISKGEYIIFVDSDDYAELDMCEVFNKIIDVCTPDIIIGDYYLHCRNHKKKVSISAHCPNQEYSGKEFLIKAISCRFFKAAVWGNAYNKESLGDVLAFDERLSVHEDMDITFRLLSKAVKVSICNRAVYNYLLTDESLMYTANSQCKKHSDMVAVLEKWMYAALDESDEMTKRIINSQISKCFVNSCIYNGIIHPDFGQITRKFLLTNEFGMKEEISTIFFLMFPRLYIMMFEVYIRLFNDGIRHINVKKWCDE